MKTCTKCKKDHLEDNFAFRNKAKNQRIAVCKCCMQIYNKTLYRKNSAAYKASSNRSMHNRRLELRNKLQIYMQDKSCVDCGERDIVVLTFDHINPDHKHKGIARLMSDGVNWDKILEEIAKCAIRCCNCHARRTAKQFDWQKLDAGRFTDPYGH